jgi:hypothetical protein
MCKLWAQDALWSGDLWQLLATVWNEKPILYICRGRGGTCCNSTPILTAVYNLTHGMPLWFPVTSDKFSLASARCERRRYLVLSLTQSWG